MNTIVNVSSKSSEEKRFGRPQIIRVLVSSYLADLREAKGKGK